MLVSAPTGSGKTLVAAYAIAANMATGAKSFYTTPLKALSNQKFGELAGAHGADSVGLLTGDVAIGSALADRGHDDRGPPQHAAGRLRPLGGPRHRGARRGPLPPGPLPRRGVGGGPRALPARGDLRLPVGDRVQRHRARRVAALGPRADRGDRRTPAAESAAPPLRGAPARGPDDRPAARSSPTAGPAARGVRVEQAVRRAGSVRQPAHLGRGRYGGPPAAGPRPAAAAR